MRKYISILALTFICIVCKSWDDAIQVPLSLNYLALGDSYTIGQVVEASQRWPNQLSENLADDGYEIQGTTIIVQTRWKPVTY